MRAKGRVLLSGDGEKSLLNRTDWDNMSIPYIIFSRWILSIFFPPHLVEVIFHERRYSPAWTLFLSSRKVVIPNRMILLYISLVSFPPTRSFLVPPALTPLKRPLMWKPEERARFGRVPMVYIRLSPDSWNATLYWRIRCIFTLLTPYYMCTILFITLIHLFFIRKIHNNLRTCYLNNGQV